MAALSIVVKSASRTYVNCPVSVAVPDADLPAAPLALADRAGNVIPAQLENGADGPVLHAIIPSLAAGEERLFEVIPAPAPGEGVCLTQNDERIEVRIGGELFTSYLFGAEWSRPFLHPLTGPSGPVTRLYPVEELEGEKQDHIHHKGCWVAWGEVNGNDFWSDGPEHGQMAHQEFLEVTDGPVFGCIRARNDWNDKDGAKQLEEEREYRFYRLPTGARAFDQRVSLRAVAGPVHFGDTKEGGFCSVRVATSMDASKDGVIANSHGGAFEGETWGKRADWCDYYGPVNDQIAGVAVFDNPGNFRYPTYWHVRNYGLMTANPFGLSYFYGDPERDGGYTLEAGGELTFNYRVLVHAGDTVSARVADQYHHYLNPPQVTVA